MFNFANTDCYNLLLQLRIINNYISMSQTAKKKTSIEPSAPQKHTVAPSSKQQHQIEQKLIHLQTILMLSQLNSTYFQLNLSLTKVTNKLQNTYFKAKMKAFLCIVHYGNDSINKRTKTAQIMAKQKRDLFLKSEGPLQLSLIDQQNSVNENIKRNISKRTDPEELKFNLIINCKLKIQRIAKLYSLKQKRLVSFGLHKLMNYHQLTLAQICSQKSSRLQTNDSQKSKIFRRSLQKKVNRKSFSLQKSGSPTNHQYYVPIKYQPSRLQTPVSVHGDDNSESQYAPNSSTLNRFLQDFGELRKDRTNQLTVNRQRKAIKYSSTKKCNMSLVSQEKQQKIKEMQYLKRKYKKLIDEFNWFSERFLKVIQEQQIVQ